MNQWGCCRLCLTVECLYPIFTIPEHNNKYTSIISTVTGVKVELNDDLPQDMCSSCIHFVNRCYKYRKKCEQTQIELSERLQSKQFHIIKVEIEDLKMETELTNVIDISELLVDDDFKDYDDNVTLDTFCNEKTEHNNVVIEKNIQDVTDKPLEIFNNKKRRKKCKDINRDGRKKERVKEEVECEYCHKILTSKLSLRNHYKIHTGFDVVCEHCGKKFITRRLLLMHCRARHGYEKTDKCSYCDYKASNAEQVKIHERLHTGEKPFVCSDCGAGFHRKSSYLQHVAIHLPEKTVQCDECPARFKSTTLMRIHKNRHRAPQYTFKCLVCDNNFARKRNVGRHLQRIHGLSPDSAHIERLKIS